MTIAEQIAELEREWRADVECEATGEINQDCRKLLFANARLFAAAEAMRDALKMAVFYVEHFGNSRGESGIESDMKQIDAALALAEPQEQGK